MWEAIVYALWVFLPAYVANMSPVISAKIFPRLSHAIDGGRTDAKGRPILGPGKTWRGLIGGAIFGGGAALGVAYLAQSWAFVDGWDYGLSGDPAAHELAIFGFGAWVGFMALVGDAVKSYFKRRTGRKRGAPWFPFDQLDFVIVGVLAMFAGFWMLPEGWLMSALLDDWLILTTLFVLTPLLHFLVNVVGYWLKLKEVPW